MLNLELARGAGARVNDWQAAEWLDREPRLRASIIVAYEDGPAAAAEIDRLAGDPRFVQVLMLVAHDRADRAAAATGRSTRPASATACRSASTSAAGAATRSRRAGFPSFYIEDAAAMAAAFQAQVGEPGLRGRVRALPGLRIVLIEGGFAWLAAADVAARPRLAQAARSEVPDLDRLPSELIREHVWLTTQPMDEPERPAQYLELLEQLAMDDRIMFSTDYPHWDFDSPDRALPAGLPDGVRRGILHDNAAALYDLRAPC